MCAVAVPLWGTFAVVFYVVAVECLSVRARVRRERRATALAKEVVVVLDDDAGKTTTTEKRRRWTRRGGLRGGRVRGRARVERSAFLSRRLEAAEDDVERLRCETRGNEDVYEKACEKRHAHDAEDCFLMFNERNTKRVVTIRGFGERCDVDVVEPTPLLGGGQRHTDFGHNMLTCKSV